MGMQDADDLYALPLLPIDHQMRAAGMNPYGGRELVPFPGHFREAGKQIEQSKQTIRVAVRLLNTPRVGTVLPDPRKIFLGNGPNGPTVICWHVGRAFGP